MYRCPLVTPASDEPVTPWTMPPASIVTVGPRGELPQKTTPTPRRRPSAMSASNRARRASSESSGATTSSAGNGSAGCALTSVAKSGTSCSSSVRVRCTSSTSRRPTADSTSGSAFTAGIPSAEGARVAACSISHTSARSEAACWRNATIRWRSTPGAPSPVNPAPLSCPTSTASSRPPASPMTTTPGCSGHSARGKTPHPDRPRRRLLGANELRPSGGPAG